MTVLDDTLAVIREDAKALGIAAARGHFASLTTAPDAVLVHEIAWARHYAEGRGGVDALAIEDYEHDRAAYCARILDALWRSAQIHHAPELWPVLTCTDRIHLYAVRVQLGWAVLDADVWRRVVAQPELVGDGLDDCGGGTAGVVLVLEARGPVTYRRAERVWARDGAAHEAALEAADRLAEALIGETMGEDHDA